MLVNLDYSFLITVPYIGKDWRYYLWNNVAIVEYEGEAQP